MKKISLEQLKKQLEKKHGKISFGMLLRAWREQEEESLASLADKLGIAKGSMQALENGKQVPSPKRVAGIAKKLKLSEKTLMELALRDSLFKNDLKYTVILESELTKGDRL